MQGNAEMGLYGPLRAVYGPGRARAPACPGPGLRRPHRARGRHADSR